MFKWVKKLFPSERDKLEKRLLETKMVTIARKEEFYHEISEDGAGDTVVRVYSRKDGFVMEEKTTDPINTAIRLLSKYNGDK